MVLRSAALGLTFGVGVSGGHLSLDALDGVGFPAASISPLGVADDPDLAAVDCGIKQLAWEYARSVQPWHGDFTPVYDALQLSNCTNAKANANAGIEARSTRPASAGWGVDTKRSKLTTEGGTQVYVDPVAGDDTQDGSEGSPLKSIEAAMTMVRAAGAAGSSVILSEGTHYLSDGIVLTPDDSGLSIVNKEGESPVVSGGVVLDLKWEAWTPSHLKGADSGSYFQADLPPGLSFTQLFADGSREIRARHPNADPETEGMHTENTGYFEADAGSWSAHNPYEPATEVQLDGPDDPARNGSQYTTYQMGYGGPADHWSPSRSYWSVSEPQGGGASTYVITSGVDFDPSLLPSDAEWTNPTEAVVHAFHNGYWGNWQFRVNASSDGASGSLRWTEGGFQEARGRDAGAEFYIENVLELLDSPREWYADTTAGKLYYLANGTSAPTEVVVPQIEALISVAGTQDAPVKDVLISGLTLKHSTSTFLEAYEVPSGGDWSVHRGGMVVLEGAEGVTVENTLFSHPGGNGLVLSNYLRDTHIYANEFAFTGDSAIVSVGTVDENDGTDGNQPRGVKIEANLGHEIGIWGKQAGFLYQGLSAQAQVLNNVAFNGPRAGINLNDGFGGGHHIEGNLIFNMVRETCDHGPINSWDRLPLLTTVKDGVTPSYFPKVSNITNNFLINNYQSVWPLDHDDGSCYYHDTENLLVYGGYKTYIGDHKVVEDNLYIYPDGSTHQFGQVSCANYDSAGLGEEWKGNRCVMASGADTYSNFGCDSSDPMTKPFTANNAFYTPNAEWSVTCATDSKTYDLEGWQALGYDEGTTVSEAPDTDTIMQWARDLMGL